MDKAKDDIAKLKSEIERLAKLIAEFEGTEYVSEDKGGNKSSGNSGRSSSSGSSSTMIINISSGCREGDCPQKDLDELENELKEDPLANGTSLVKIEETFDDLTDDELPQPDTVFDQDNSS